MSPASQYPDEQSLIASVERAHLDGKRIEPPIWRAYYWARRRLKQLREAIDEQSMRMGYVCPHCQAPRRGICPSGCDDIVRIPGAR